MGATLIYNHAPKGANRVQGMENVHSIFGRVGIEPDLLADDEM